MYITLTRNRGHWWIGALWNRWSGLEVQLGPLALWVFPGRRTQ
jgi:hypothetical protein